MVPTPHSNRGKPLEPLRTGPDVIDIIKAQYAVERANPQKATKKGEIPQTYELITTEWLEANLAGDVAGASVAHFVLGPVDDGTLTVAPPLWCQTNTPRTIIFADTLCGLQVRRIAVGSRWNGTRREPAPDSRRRFSARQHSHLPTGTSLHLVLLGYYLGADCKISAA